MESAARSPNDGYTLAQAGGSQFSVVPLMQKLNYDPLKDLTPISIIAVNSMALAVNNDLPVRSVKEFIDYAKANPGKLNYGTGGVGTSSHLVPAAFAARAGIDMVAIPYQSTPASIVGVVSGSVHVFFWKRTGHRGIGPRRTREVLACRTPNASRNFPMCPRSRRPFLASS